jgi:lysophospholipase L1-like esterase
LKLSGRIFIIIALIGLLAPQTFAAKPVRKRAHPKPKSTSVSPRVRAALNEQIARQVHQSKIAIENPAALIPFFERLNQSKQQPGGGPVSILHYGDSHTAADEWTSDLRILFQEQFGNAGAGFSHAGRPWSTYRRTDVKSSATRNWHTEGGLSARDGDGLYGLSGIAIATSLPNESIYLQADGSLLEVFYLQQPNGGSLDLSDNGEHIENIATDGPLGPGYFRRSVAAGSHSYSLRTIDAAPVRLFGWVTGNPEGVTYETLGINGAQASIALDWHPQLLTSHIHDRNPALIVLAYGTNEAGSPKWTEENYRQMFSQVLALFREAAPNTSILVIGPPDRNIRVKGRSIAHRGVDRIVAAQKSAAASAGCAFYDLRAKAGGPGIMNKWFLAGLAQRDRVHFTANGYHLIAQALFADLMREYDRFNVIVNNQRQ